MNFLKRDLEYVMEVYPHGWLLTGNGEYHGIPADALKQVQPLFDKDYVCDNGIAGALGAVLAIGIPEHLAAWRKQITAQLADANLPKEIQWVRGVDCGLSSGSLFCKLATSHQAIIEARHRFGWSCDDAISPRDADDFGRCLRMVEFCGWQGRLAEAHGISMPWDRILERWEPLCELYGQGKLDVVDFG